jgi:hypothetical protein
MIRDQLRGFPFWTYFDAGQQHREKSKRPELRMNEAGILARPSEACCDGKRSLDNRTGIDISTRFEFAKVFSQFRIESFETLEQHLVIIAGPPLAFFIDTRRPCVTRDPPTPWVLRFG